MSKAANEELIQELNAKFPLAQTLRFRRNQDSSSDHLPPVIALFAAMTGPGNPGATCAVVPSRENIAAVVSILSAFQAAKLRAPILLEQYIKTSFEIGERVRVLPTGFVCRFGGYLEYGDKRFFRLLVDAESNACRSFPLDEGVRLEKTNQELSRTRNGHAWGEFQRSKLDFLIGTRTGGNNALMENEVVIVTTIKSFKDFLEETIVAASDHPEHQFPLSEVVPWGVVNADGELEFRNSAAATGAPLIAVSPRAEYVAEFCRKNGNHSPRVIVDGASRVRDLQALDDIVDRSKTLIFSDHAELDLLAQIKNRGCRIWRMPDGQTSLVGKGNGALGYFREAYYTASNFVMNVVACESPIIDDIARRIFEAENTIRENDPDETILKFVSFAFARLLDVCALLHDPQEAEKDELCKKIGAAVRDLEARRTFIPPAALENMKIAFEQIGQCIQSLDSRITKQLALLTQINDLGSRGLAPVVVCYNSLAANSAAAFLSKETKSQVKVVTLAEYLEGAVAEHVILTAWPRARNLTRLICNYAAKNIHALGYGFEQAWFLRADQRRKRELSRWDTSSDLGNIAGLKAALIKMTTPATPEQLPKTLGTAIDFEERLSKLRKGTAAAVVLPHETKQARYVGFVGLTYCYLTEGHGLPKVTSILRGVHQPKASVPIGTVADLVPGDLVLFRVSADTDKDMIRYLAEQLSAPGEYERVRKTAELWKDALRSLGKTPQTIARLLHDGGLDRTDQSIRTWLTNPNHIGPGQEQDLYSIARVARNADFEKKIPKIWSAIQATRGAHTTAGFKLSQLLVQELPRERPRLSDGETIVELTLESIPLGKVAIVEVEEIADVAEDRPSWEVNRLLSDETKVHG